MKLHTHNLVKKYRNRTVVDHVSIEVEQGEIVGLLGPNGAGKTTSFYMIVGLIRPREGSIYLNEENITTLPVYKRARKGIGYLAQEPSVFRNLSVEDNIKAVLEMSGMSKGEQSERLETLLNEFGLQKIRKSKGVQLSGEKEDVPRLPGLSPSSPNSSCSTSLSRESTRLPWRIYRKSSPN